jgi:hypothetical protein
VGVKPAIKARSQPVRKISRRIKSPTKLTEIAVQSSLGSNSRQFFGDQIVDGVIQGARLVIACDQLGGLPNGWELRGSFSDGRIRISRAFRLRIYPFIRSLESVLGHCRESARDSPISFLSYPVDCLLPNFPDPATM